MLWHRTIGKGQNLVLLHGWAFNSDIFHELVVNIRMITALQLSIYLVMEEVLILKVSIEDWCNEIIRLIPEKSILLGWSLGGLLSIFIANQIKLKELILVAASPCLVNNDNWDFGIRQ